MKEAKDSFVFITAGYEVTRKNISNNLNISYEEDLSKINKTLSSLRFISASGFVLKHLKDSSLVSTSNHVCESFSELEDSIDNVLIKTFLQNIKDNMTKDSLLFNLNYEIKPVVVLTDFYGNKHISNKVVAADKKNDLCIISSNDLIGKPVQFAKSCNEEEIFNISTSGGFYIENGVPLRKGFLNRIIKKIEYRENVYFENVYMYSLSVLPGSSGSAVFNAEGKVCGNINISQPNLGISYGASSSTITLQLQDYLSSL